MITKDDLEKIREVVREEVEAEVKPVRREITFSSIKLETRIHDTQDKLKDVNIKLNKIGKDIKSIKSEVRFIKEALNATIGHFEQEDIKLQKRLERIEDQIELS